MTREERNRAISEIRNQWHLLSGFTKTIPEDWHADANWPTLLREMLADDNCEVSFGHWSDSSYHTVKNGTPFYCDTDHANNYKRSELRTNAPTIEDAVTEAWLKWKAK